MSRRKREDDDDRKKFQKTKEGRRDPRQDYRDVLGRMKRILRAACNYSIGIQEEHRRDAGNLENSQRIKDLAYEWGIEADDPEIEEQLELMPSEIGVDDEDEIIEISKRLREHIGEHIDELRDYQAASENSGTIEELLNNVFRLDDLVVFKSQNINKFAELTRLLLSNTGHILDRSVRADLVDSFLANIIDTEMTDYDQLKERLETLLRELRPDNRVRP